MIACPVCEHQQADGFECDVCGKDLSAALGSLPPPPVAIARLAEMEATIGERVGEVPVEPLGELETNLQAATPDAPTGTAPDVERTRLDPTGEVAVEPLTDRTEDRAPDDGQKTAAPAGALTCRYCRNVQASGAVCERCGMRLPVAMAVEAKAAGPEVWTRCRACGAVAIAEQRCRDCGQLVPHPDA